MAKQPDTTTLNGAIMALPRPTNMQFSFGRQWGPESAGMWQGASDFGQLGKYKQATGLNPFNQQSMDALFNGMIRAFQGSGYEAAVQSRQKIGVNKYNVMVFQDLPFREISLQFTLRPRTPEKAKMFVEAIKTLKTLSAPMLDKDGNWNVEGCTFALEFPYEGDGQPYIFKSNEMVITSLTTDYTPNGFWSQHYDKMPTQTNLSLNLQEIALAYRDKENPDRLIDGVTGEVY